MNYKKNYNLNVILKAHVCLHINETPDHAQLLHKDRKPNFPRREKVVSRRGPGNILNGVGEMNACTKNKWCFYKL